MIYLASIRGRNQPLLALYNDVLVSLPDNEGPVERRFRASLIRGAIETSINERRHAHHHPVGRGVTWQDKIQFSQVRWDAILRHGTVVGEVTV